MQRPLDRNFFVGITLVFLFFSSMLLGIITWSNDHDDVLQLGSITYHEWGYFKFPITTTTEHYRLLRIILTTTCSISGLILLLSFLKRGGIARELIATATELAQACRGLFLSVRLMSLPQRWLAASILLLIAGLRLYYLFTYPAHTDEVASYDYFVTEGWLAITGYYPLANNHVLFNLIAKVFHSLNDGFYWTMRLPSLLIGLTATILAFLILVRISTFFIAAFSTLLFSLSQMGVFLLFSGRGYPLFILFACLTFFALYQLYKGTRYSRAHWAVFAASAILGFYSLPAFLYPFLSASIIGVVLFLKARSYAAIGQLIMISVPVVLTVILLYLPIMVISGPEALFANRYVAPIALSEMLKDLPNILLSGHSLGPWFFWGVVAAFFLTLIFIRPFPVKWLAIACVLQVLLPYIYMIAQRVQPPDRVLFYRQFFVFLLVAIVIHVLLERLRLPQRHMSWLLILPLGFGVDQMNKMNAEIAPLQQRKADIQAVHEILRSRPYEEVLIMEPFYELFLYHQAKRERMMISLVSAYDRIEDPKMIVIGHNYHDEYARIDHALYEEIYKDHHVKVLERRVP